ncbi:MAG: hypothetical protein HOV83_23175 [Catenulispora sp.]|nr:hypothetical protein [Catenulispora sp.]
MNENEIRDLLGAEIGEEPPIVGGPAAVFAAARARVVRTRAVTGALSAVAVLGVAAGVVVVSGGSGSGQEQVSVGAGTTSPAGKPWSPGVFTSAPGQHTAVPAPKPGPGQVLIDGHSAALILKGALPAGLTTGDYSGQDSSMPDRSGVRVLGAGSVDDGSGRPVGIHAGISQNGSLFGWYEDANCAAQQRMSDAVSDCRADRQPDGSIVMVFRQRDYHSAVSGPTVGSYQTVAERAFPDGTVIFAAAQNYFDPPGDPHEYGWHVNPSRTDPLLTREQVEAIVLDPHWALTVSAEFAEQAKQVVKPYVDQSQKS